MQTPFLWSGIYLLPWCTGRGYQKSLEILIQRSHLHPLDIEITLDESHSPQYINRRNRMRAFLHPLDASTNIQLPETNHCLQAQLDIAVVEVSRWRSFTYRCDYPGDVSEIMERLAYLSAPILESFELKASLRGRNGSEIQNPDIFLGGAPMLTHVHIDGVDPLSCLPPLSFVTSLRLGGARGVIGGGDLLSILQSSPVLVSLHFEGTVVDLEDLYQLYLMGGYIDIQTLRSFSFSASASPKYCIDGILNAIRCPALESLTISKPNVRDGVQPLELPSTQAFPMPPFPMLRSLKLSWIQCAQFAEHFDLTHLPALDTISLTNCESPMAVLHLLLPQGINNSGNVWPVLRVIALSHLGPKEFDDLCNIILHRRACGRPIVAVEIDPVSLRNFPVQVEWLKQHVTVQRGERVHYPSDFPSHFPLMNVPTQSETAL